MNSQTEARRHGFNLLDSGVANNVASGMNFTGERVVPCKMPDHVHVLQEHIARYNFALGLIKSSDTVLDAACGTGYGTMILSWRGQEVIVQGMDRDAESISHAKENFWCGADAGKRVLYCVADVATDPPVKCSLLFDVIVSYETIEHVDPDNYFKFIKANLHKDGTLIVSTPINPDKTSQNPHHKFEWDAAEFKENILKHFAEVEFYRQDGITITKVDADDLETGEKGYGIAVCRGIKD